MSKEEIVALVKSLQDMGVTRNPLWAKAFEIYNSDSFVIENGLKLGMGCRPCYSKVAAYLIQKYL